MLFSLLTLLLFNTAPSGFLSVNSIPPGLSVFVEGESIGRTPVERQVSPGIYWVTVVSNDSLQRLYHQLRDAKLLEKLSALWELARIDAGTTQVEVLPGCETEVIIDSKAMEKNVCRAKWLVAGGVGGIFGLGFLLGLVIGFVAQ
ncbi:MAG: PEGA domain-containing protein [candidate division WOR-3 bacterium]